MHEFLYQDSSFDLTNSEKYNLSIQAGLDGFSVLMQNDEDGSIEFLTYIPYMLSGEPGLMRKLPELLSAKDILGKSFRKTTIILESKQFKIVPDQLVNEKNVKYLFNLKPKEIKRRSFIITPLTENYQSLFGYNSEIIEFFEGNFPDCTITHELSEMIKPCLKTKVQGNILIYCLFHKDYLHVFTTQNNDILFHNYFSFQSPSDILFYLFSVYKMYKEETMTLTVAGNINEQSDEFRTIIKYFPAVKFWETNHLRLISDQLKGLEPYRIAPLLSSVLQ